MFTGVSDTRDLSFGNNATNSSFRSSCLPIIWQKRHNTNMTVFTYCFSALLVH